VADDEEADSEGCCPDDADETDNDEDAAEAGGRWNCTDERPIWAASNLWLPSFFTSLAV
jgi:hypothetical protein